MTRPGTQADPDASKPFDVLIVVSHLGAGGMQRVVTSLANAWSANGYKVGVVVRGTNVKDAFVLSSAVSRIELPAVVFRRRLLYVATIFSIVLWAWKLRSTIKKSKTPRVVSFIRTTNVQVILACLGLKNVRVVISERNDPLRQNLGKLAPFWNLMSRLLYRYADVVTANSRGVLDSMKSYVPADRLAHVPNPLTIPHADGGVFAEHPVVLAVGRLVPQKGYDVLLAAFACFAARHPDWLLWMVGDGPLRGTLKRQADELGISARVRWVGAVADPFPYYRTAEIFALSSRYEGMPNALLEAMGCGLPAVVTNASPGPLEVVEHEKSGLVVPSDDAERMSAALGRLAEDRALRHRLGQAARQRMAEFLAPRALAVWDKTVGLAESSPSDMEPRDSAGTVTIPSAFSGKPGK